MLAPLFDGVLAGGEWGAVLMAGPVLLARLAATDWRGALTARQGAQLLAWSASANALTGRGHRATEAPAAPPGTEPASVLSTREFDVLRCIVAGDSNKVIARALDLSPHTVKRHVSNILDQVALASRGQAAQWYRAHR